MGEGKQGKGMESVLTAFEQGQDQLLIDFMAKCEGKLLDLSDKKLGNRGATAVAKGLQVNNNMKALNLRNDGIGDEGAAHISSALKVNTCLTNLDVSSAWDIHDEEKIGTEGAKAFAEALKVNTTLTVLNLALNNLRQDGAAALGKALEVNATLTTLCINSNGIGPEGAQSMADAIKENKSLQTLDLRSNPFGDVGASALGSALMVNTALTSLDVAFSNIGPVGAQAIAECLKVNKILQSLSLACNNLGPQGAELIAQALKVNTTLISLNVAAKADAGSNITIGEEGAKALADALKVNSTLTSLSIEDNKIGPVVGTVLGEALKVNTALQVLVLINNELGSEGAEAIADALKVNSTLTSIDFYCNSIGPEGTKQIAKALEVNSSLSWINLDDNRMGPDGARHMAQALKDHPSVTSVDLRNNKLSVDVGWELAAVAKRNPRIKEMCGVPIDSLRDMKTTELELQKKNLGPAGAAILAEFLTANQTLRQLSLERNALGADGACAIADALKGNKTLIELSLRRNDIGPAGVEAIASMLQQNTTLESIDLRGNQNVADVIIQAVYVKYHRSQRFQCFYDGDCKLLSNQRLQIEMSDKSKRPDHPGYLELCARIVWGVPLAALWASVEFMWGMLLGIYTQQDLQKNGSAFWVGLLSLGCCCWTVWLPLVLLVAVLSPSSSLPSYAAVLSCLGGAMILFVLRIAWAIFRSNAFSSLLPSNSNVPKMDKGNLDNALALAFMVVALVQFSDFAILLDSFPVAAVAWMDLFYLRFVDNTSLLRFWAAFCVACLWLGYSSILLWEKGSGPYFWISSDKPKFRFLTHLPGGETAITLLSDSLFLIVLVALLDFFSCSPDDQSGLLMLDVQRKDGAAPVLCWTGWHLGYTCAAVAVLVPYVIYCTTLGIEFMEDITGATQLQFTELSAVLERLASLVLACCSVFFKEHPRVGVVASLAVYTLMTCWLELSKKGRSCCSIPGFRYYYSATFMIPVWSALCSLLLPHFWGPAQWRSFGVLAGGWLLILVLTALRCKRATTMYLPVSFVDMARDCWSGVKQEELGTSRSAEEGKPKIAPEVVMEVQEL